MEVAAAQVRVKVRVEDEAAHVLHEQVGVEDEAAVEVEAAVV